MALCTLALSTTHQDELFAHLKTEIVEGRLVILVDTDDAVTVDGWRRYVPVPSEIHRALRKSGLMSRWYRKLGGEAEVELSADTRLVMQIQQLFRDALRG